MGVKLVKVPRKFLGLGISRLLSIILPWGRPKVAHPSNTITRPNMPICDEVGQDAGTNHNYWNEEGEKIKPWLALGQYKQGPANARTYAWYEYEEYRLWDSFKSPPNLFPPAYPHIRYTLVFPFPSVKHSVFIHRVSLAPCA